MWVITNFTLVPGQSRLFDFTGPGDCGGWAQVNDKEVPVAVPGYYVIYGLLNSFWTPYEAGSKVIAICDELAGPNASVATQEDVVDVGESMLFDASSSTDILGMTEDLEYRWDWDGDGNFDTDWSSSPTMEHTFDSGGEFVVTVSVKDPAGLQSEASTTVVVQETVPEYPVVAAVTLAMLAIALFYIRRSH
jgi:hypothetical protein